MDLPQGLQAALGDRYAVVREVGRGGMATVYLAEDLKHRRQVAVKVLHPDLASMLGRARFLRGEGFVPKNHLNIGLGLQGFGKTPGAAPFKGGMAIIVERLPDNDETSIVRFCNFRNGRSVQQAGNVVEHCQRVGDGAA